jgi:uncharacterized metal-binding protein YceD (DUF177 family)
MKRDDLLDLNDVLQHPGRTISVEIGTEMETVEDLDLVSALEGTLECVSTGNLLLVTGHFQTTAVIECARCAAPVEVEVEFDVDEQFKVDGTPSSFNSQDMANVVDDEPYPLFEGNSLMVEELLRQDLLLNMPVHPVCKDPSPECLQVAEQAKIDKEEGRLEFKRLSELIGSDG